MKWTVHGERQLYSSYWCAFNLIDVELPTGRRFEHEALRMPLPAVATAVHDAERGAVLMIWRHRLITDAWGWELPAGRVEEGEELVEASRRETLEETGWEPTGLEHALTFHPSSGMSDQVFHVFTATGAVQRGEPTDLDEAARVDWIPLDSVRSMIKREEIVDGLAINGLLWLLT